MEKKLDAIKSTSISTLILELNNLKINKEELVQIIPPNETNNFYIAIFYYGREENN